MGKYGLVFTSLPFLYVTEKKNKVFIDVVDLKLILNTNNTNKMPQIISLKFSLSLSWSLQLFSIPKQFSVLLLCLPLKFCCLGESDGFPLALNFPSCSGELTCSDVNSWAQLSILPATSAFYPDTQMPDHHSIYSYLYNSSQRAPASLEAQIRAPISGLLKQSIPWHAIQVAWHRASLTPSALYCTVCKDRDCTHCQAQCLKYIRYGIKNILNDALMNPFKKISILKCFCTKKKICKLLFCSCDHSPRKACTSAWHGLIPF